MTIILETWQNTENAAITANIEVQKFCHCIDLVISETIDGGPFATSLFRNTYTDKASARRAMRNYAKSCCGGSWVKTYDNKTDTRTWADSVPV